MNFDKRLPGLVSAVDLFYAVEVTAAFKFGVHENVNHLFCIAVAYKTGGYANDVGVVVFAGQFGQFFTPANSGTNAMVFIGCNGHTIGTSAEQDAKGGFPVLYRKRHGMRKVGVINGILTVGTEVFINNILCLKVGDQVFLAIETGMIAADGYGEL